MGPHAISTPLIVAKYAAVAHTYVILTLIRFVGGDWRALRDHNTKLSDIRRASSSNPTLVPLALYAY